MAGTKISALPSATTLAGTEVVPVVQDGSSKKATITQLLAGVNLSSYALTASPTFTGSVTIPTPSAGSNTTIAASTAWTRTYVTSLGYTSNAGTVESVGLSLPSLFSVSGSPVTTTGTLTATLATQGANVVLAGPTTGSAAAPTFRALVAADLPATAVTAGSYGSASAVAQFTVDAAGRVTAATPINIAIPSSAVSGLGTAAATASTDYATAAQGTDSREWSADTISQAEAEAGTATTRRAYTAQRVFQSIAAWWAASAAATKLAGIASGATANSSDAQLRDRSTHTGTQAFSTLTGAPCEIGVACSDETTALTTGTGKVTFRMPYAMTLTAVRVNVNTAVTVAALEVNLKEGGTTVFSTTPKIAVGEKTSLAGLSTPGTINDSNLANDAEMTLDIVQAGGAAKGLKIWLIGTRA